MKAGSQNLSLKPWQRFSSMTLWILTRTQLENIGKNHEVSAEVWRYLKQHVLPRADESR
jgi:hypothetical protein